MITYEDYVKDLDKDLICNETFAISEKKERRRRKCFEKAERLKEHDLSKYKTREEAEDALQIQGAALVIGTGGIIFVILSSIISWMVQKLLDKHFGQPSK